MTWAGSLVGAAFNGAYTVVDKTGDVIYNVGQGLQKRMDDTGMTEKVTTAVHSAAGSV